MAESRAVVLAALVANGAIAILKFGGFLLTGSPAMLSEAYHSVSDTGNQVFLLIGLRFSSRDPTARHPFGYGKAEFFYSFLVAVLLFGIAGWESAKHGYNAIVNPGHATGQAVELFGMLIPPVWVNYVILGGAFVFESWALYKARAGMLAQIQDRGWSGYREAFTKTSDVTTLTALTEDTIALLGILLAFLGVLLTDLTGNHIFDALSAFLIGVMLMGFALALAWQNKRLLIGESLSQARVTGLREVVANHDGVEGVSAFRAVFVGPEELLVTADVEFADGLATTAIESHIDAIEAALIDADDFVARVYIEPEEPIES
jgi:cation diffusion facilitator family transporter